MGPTRCLRRVLIANRGEIAVRCIEACRTLGISSVSLFTKADASSLYVALADEAVLLGEEGARAYLDIDAILDICKERRIDAVVPGYGFLSEDPEFARRVEAAGMAFVGPEAQTIEMMGLKHTAREIAVAAGVPVIPGSGLLSDVEGALLSARALGFPVMVKASGGGGGIGMQVCQCEDEVAAAFESVMSRSRALFKDSGIFMERYYPKSHHVEVQIFGNGSDVVHFGERECSIQRRHQKVVEECPSPYVTARPQLRARLTSCATALAMRLGYRSAGTVEFLLDDETGDFFFLEVNTRLQVEHGITELCYGVDLVALMLRQADFQLAGLGGIPSEELFKMQKDSPNGAAIEVRVCCENPAASFFPSSGYIQELAWPGPEIARVDSWIRIGAMVTPYFDSLLAKVMVHSPSRQEAILAMKKAIGEAKVGGVTTNLAFLDAIIGSDAFSLGVTLTTFLEKQFEFHPRGILVEEPGILTTVQQAREHTLKGYGVPKSGPMDEMSAKIANILVGNPRDAACLEITNAGPELFFHSMAIVSVCGATFPIHVDGTAVPMWSRVIVKANQTLRVGTATRAVARCYIAIKGGLPGIPEWLGSKSTTPSLGLAGLQGRALKRGDFLDVEALTEDELVSSTMFQLPSSLIPATDVDTIYVMHGPHDSDDFVTADGREALYSTRWKIDHNCSRTGIRLVGPRIEWARATGGDAGAHPSNLVDYPYPSPGGVNWTGDSPVIFPVDGPGFGGFLCSSTVVSAELWKLGNVSPGDNIRLYPISYAAARTLTQRNEDRLRAIESVLSNNEMPDVVPENSASVTEPEVRVSDAILKSIEGIADQSSLILRQGGDCFVICDIESQQIGLKASLSARMLAEAINSTKPTAVFVHVNVSSIMVEYDPGKISQEAVVRLVEGSHQQIQGAEALEPLASRRLILPIVFDHPEIRQAEQRYSEMQRSKAVYLPDNVTYLQENNSLPSRDAVFALLKQTRFLVVAVGFMTGLPLLLPLAPRARASSRKSTTRRASPRRPGRSARAVPCCASILRRNRGGGATCSRAGPYRCGICTRSVPVSRPAGRPWLCEPFDVVEFREVGLAEYERILESFAAGTYELRVEACTLDVREELALEKRITALPETLAFRQRQRAAAEEMRVREEGLYAAWLSEQAQVLAQSAEVGNAEDEDEHSGTSFVSPHNGKIYKVLVQPGDKIEAGQTLVVLEAMKMEITLSAGDTHAGLVVKRIVGKDGSIVSSGTTLIFLCKDE